MGEGGGGSMGEKKFPTFHIFLHPPPTPYRIIQTAPLILFLTH
jgi:hypothetical protein